MEGLSARNCLSAIISTLETVDSRQVITAQLEDTSTNPIVIELTRDAVEELSLTVGSRVYLIIKSSSISVYG